MREPTHSPYPTKVGVEITGRCQLRCHHCFNRSGPERSEEIPLDVLERLLDEFASWGVDTVRISGGEPTLHRHFPELVASFSRRGLRLDLNTNGLYTAVMLDWLCTAPVSRFLVSLDGLEANHDALRGQGTFGRTVESCRRLRAAGQKVTIAMHVCQGNGQDLEGVAALAAGMGADLKLSPMRPIGRAAEALSWASLAPSDQLLVSQTVVALRRSSPQMQIATDFDLLDPTAREMCADDPASSACAAGRSMINIDFHGRVYGCAFFATEDGRTAAGTVFDGRSLTEIWQAPTTFSALRSHAKSESCQGCGFYRRRCNGGCPALAEARTGRIDALDPTCFAHLLPESP